MGFRLVPTLVTLNDLERRNDRYLAFFSRNSVALGADYVKVVEDRPMQSATEMFCKTLISVLCSSHTVSLR